MGAAAGTVVAPAFVCAMVTVLASFALPRTVAAQTANNDTYTFLAHGLEQEADDPVIDNDIGGGQCIDRIIHSSFVGTIETDEGGEIELETDGSFTYVVAAGLYPGGAAFDVTQAAGAPSTIELFLAPGGAPARPRSEAASQRGGRRGGRLRGARFGASGVGNSGPLVEVYESTGKRRASFKLDRALRRVRAQSIDIDGDGEGDFGIVGVDEGGNWTLITADARGGRQRSTPVLVGLDAPEVQLLPIARGAGEWIGVAATDDDREETHLEVWDADGGLRRSVRFEGQSALAPTWLSADVDGDGDGEAEVLLLAREVDKRPKVAVAVPGIGVIKIINVLKPDVQ